MENKCGRDRLFRDDARRRRSGRSLHLARCTWVLPRRWHGRTAEPEPWLRPISGTCGGVSGSRSYGLAAYNTLSAAGRLHFAINWLGNDLGGGFFAADFDLDGFAEFGVRGGNVPHAYAEV